MTQLIDKSALVAEIERLKKEDGNPYFPSETADKYYARGVHFTCDGLVNFLDTLEVKEVDLEKELILWHKDHFKKEDTYEKYSGFYLTNNSQLDLAIHFFELGLQASNPLTWEDMMTIHKCCKDAMNCNLYAWETAEGQQKIYEDVLKRFKAQKEK